jgi:transposase-like protein
MDTIQSVVAGGRRRRRRHTPEFKAAVVAECGHRGVSIAAVALANGLNANLVRRWVVEQERAVAMASSAHSEERALVAALEGEAFVPVTIAAAEAAGGDVRVEIRAGERCISVHWPVAAASAMAQWLRALLA